MLRIFIFLLLFAGSLCAQDPYWVSTAGAAVSWAAAQSATPLAGASCASLSQANANASAGDTVNFRAGTFSSSLKPVNSGSLGNVILFQAYNDETVIFDCGAGTTALWLDGVDYIRLYDLEATNTENLLEMENGSNYNEVDSCLLYDDQTTGNAAIKIRTNNVTEGVDDNTNNWVHDCVMYYGGKVDQVSCEDAGGLFDIGADNDLDNFSGNNTVEDCELYSGAHHVFKIKSKNNLFRNNVVSNPEDYFVASAACKTLQCSDSNFYGNRCVTILDHTQFSDGYNVIEGNRIGHAGIPSDGNGGYGMTLGASKTIARYNVIYNITEQGIYLRSSSNNADDISFYNNTVFKTGVNVCRANPGTTRHGINVQNGADNANVINNVIHDAVGDDINIGGLVVGLDNRGNWQESVDGDPQFTDETTPAVTAALSLTTPNLIPILSSGVIDNGTHLTQADGSGSSSTSLVVDNSYFFQPGGRGSALAPSLPDWIAVGTVNNVVQIASIDYGTHAITLSSPLSWSDGDSIWLYKDSSGEVVLYGSSPDQGAYEYNPAVTSGTLTTTTLTVGP